MIRLLNKYISGDTQYLYVQTLRGVYAEIAFPVTAFYDADHHYHTLACVPRPPLQSYNSCNICGVATLLNPCGRCVRRPPWQQVFLVISRAHAHGARTPTL